MNGNQGTRERPNEPNVVTKSQQGGHAVLYEQIKLEESFGAISTIEALCANRSSAPPVSDHKAVPAYPAGMHGALFS